MSIIKYYNPMSKVLYKIKIPIFAHSKIRIKVIKISGEKLLRRR